MNKSGEAISKKFTDDHDPIFTFLAVDIYLLHFIKKIFLLCKKII